MDEKRLKRWVLYFVLGVILLLVVFPPKNKVRNIGQVGFHMNSSDRLYFHNIRSFSYEREERSDWGADILEMEESWVADSTVGIHFTIIASWRREEAFLISQRSHFLEDTEFQFWIGNSIYPFDWSTANNEDHFELGAYLFNALIEEDSTAILVGGTSYPIFPDPRSKKANLTTLEDYFRLVGKYH
ncbi:MAG: hypothetical protein LPK28_05065 [Bacteroidota bacterium]|nr:hypothetical protein [Bacteroidota bacterium]